MFLGEICSKLKTKFSGVTDTQQCVLIVDVKGMDFVVQEIFPKSSASLSKLL
jgi:hypothetical protein